MKYIRCKGCDSSITIDQIEINISKRKDTYDSGKFQCSACGTKQRGNIFSEDE